MGWDLISLNPWVRTDGCVAELLSLCVNFQFNWYTSLPSGGPPCLSLDTGGAYRADVEPAVNRQPGFRRGL